MCTPDYSNHFKLRFFHFFDRKCSEHETPWELLRLDSKFKFENMTSYRDVSLCTVKWESYKLIMKCSAGQDVEESKLFCEHPVPCVKWTTENFLIQNENLKMFNWLIL